MTRLQYGGVIGLLWSFAFLSYLLRTNILAPAAVPVFGWLSTRLCGRTSPLAVRRLVASGCLITSALLLFVGAGASQPGVAIGSIGLCIALLSGSVCALLATVCWFLIRPHGTPHDELQGVKAACV